MCTQQRFLSDKPPTVCPIRPSGTGGTACSAAFSFQCNHELKLLHNVSCFTYAHAPLRRGLRNGSLRRKKRIRFSPGTKLCSWHDGSMPTCVRSAGTPNGVLWWSCTTFGQFPLALPWCVCCFFSMPPASFPWIPHTPSADASMRHLSQLI